MVRFSLTLGAVLALSSLLACPVPPPAEGEGEGEGEGEEGEGEGEGEGESGCSPNQNTGFPTPSSSLTARVGSSTTFDVGAWNIRNFPRAGQTISVVADLITSMDLDLIAVAEIEDEDAFDELMARLPNHEGVLSTHTYSTGDYQKLGFIYRCGLLAPVGAPQLPFSNDGFNFPRPPLQQKFRFTGNQTFEFNALAVHFKASEGNNDTQSSARRRTAFERLETYVDSLISAGPEEVVVLGDFNERLDDADGASNWAPFLDESEYVVRSRPLSDRGEASFLSSNNALIDHIVTSRGLDNEVGAGTTSIPHLEQDVLNYRDSISDHRPITLVMRGVN